MQKNIFKNILFKFTTENTIERKTVYATVTYIVWGTWKREYRIVGFMDESQQRTPTVAVVVTLSTKFGLELELAAWLGDLKQCAGARLEWIGLCDATVGLC